MSFFSFWRASSARCSTGLCKSIGSGGATGSVVTVLYAMDPVAAAKVARLLFFYGWQSAVVFDEGTVTKREMWQEFQAMKEVRLDEQR